MFGFSLAELIVVLLVILIFVRPSDLPEIAHFIGRAFYRIKRIYDDLKRSFKDIENQFGIDDLKHELNRGIAEEKSKLEDDFTVIVDMDGKEHRVPNLTNLRDDLTKEELDAEIKKENEKNKRPNS
jgi:Sec-independent protein translocase protein TatA